MKVKKGFKVDRVKARKDPANMRKGKRGKEAAAVAMAAPAAKTAVARPKVIKFDTTAMKDYVTGFHQRKNQRRMFAIKKAKDDHRAQVNAERKDRREERRRMYNKISQFQINESFKLEMPGMESDSGVEASDDDDEDDDDDSGMDEQAELAARKAMKTQRQSFSGSNADTVVDVEVGQLDLGGAFGSAAVRQARDDSDDDDDDDAGNAFPSNSAFPSAPAVPTRVRLIRKRR